MTERVKKLLLLYCKQGGKIRRVSGLPLLTFKAKKAGNLKNYRIYGNTETKTRSYSGSAPLSFPITDGAVSNYRVYGNTVNGESVGDLVTDSQSEHYGEYAIPITNNSENANIYLPEPIKMIGDEAEYIDYAEQKQHKVRKNLLQNTATSQTISGVTFTVNSDGSIVCDGQTSSSTAVLIFSNFLVPSGTYILTGCPNGGSERGTYKMLLFINGAWFANDMGSGVNFTLTKTSTVSVRIDIYNGYTCDNLTFYPMLRKADIEDDTYEPYIENTEVDVTLPALPAQSTSNSLSIGATVQPSSVAVNVGEVVSCGDKTRNLFDINLSHIPGYINNEGTMQNASYPITTWDYLKVDSSTTYAIKAFNVKDETSGYINFRVSFYDINKNFLYRISAVPDGLFETPDRCAYVRFSIDDNLCDIMLIKSTSLPDTYEPYGYKIPITLTAGSAETTDIYLDEPLRKVGNESDYIDYVEQKQHWVRKNLLQNTATSQTRYGVTFTINSDGTVSVNGIVTETVFFSLKSDVSYPFDTILSGCAQGGSRDGYYLRAQSTLQTLYSDYGNGALIPANAQVFIEIRIQKGTECNNLEFKPMIRKADIEDVTYEPYIENTEVDVTLPEIAVTAGINTLTVGTEVQPSGVEIKGRIKAAGGD